MAKKNKIGLNKVEDANKEILFDILADKCVEIVNVEFSGSGDDGQVEASDLPEEIRKIVVKGTKVSKGKIWTAGKFVETFKENPTVGEVIDSLCYEVLENLYGGWENDDGAFGDFVFDVKSRKVLFNFNERFTESRLHEHEF